MSDTINYMPTVIDQQQLAQELVEAARADGVELVGHHAVVRVGSHARSGHQRATGYRLAIPSVMTSGSASSAAICSAVGF